MNGIFDSAHFLRLIEKRKHLIENFENVDCELLDDEMFDDIFLQMDGSNVEINNLTLTCPSKKQQISVNKLFVNLRYMALEVELDMGTLVLTGDYEFYNPKHPVTDRGKILITLERIIAKGQIGFMIKGDKTNFKSTNFDLKYNPEHVEINLSSQSADVTVQNRNRSALDQLMLKSFGQPLWAHEENIIRARLDSVLDGLSVTEMLSGDKEHIKEFAAREFVLDDIANSVIDKLLVVFKENIKGTTFTHTKIKDIDTTFNQKIGFINIKGYFAAGGGRAGNLSTVERNSKFSVTGDESTNTLAVFGDLKLQNLRVNYKEYKAKLIGIGPRGSLTVVVNSNSVFVKLIASNVLTSNMRITVADVKVKVLGDMKVKATGLGPLNWLLSLIGKWVLGLLKESVVPRIEHQLLHEINQMLKGMDVVGSLKQLSSL